MLNILIGISLNVKIQSAITHRILEDFVIDSSHHLGSGLYGEGRKFMSGDSASPKESPDITLFRLLSLLCYYDWVALCLN